MAVYTPRGLKIRLPVDYCFALIARLYPDVDAFKVLKRTEGLELIPSLLAFVTGLVCFSLKLEPFQIGSYTFLASLIGFIVTLRGFYLIPGLSALGTLFSYVAGFGIYLIVGAILGLVLVGWQGMVAFFVGRFLEAWLVQPAVEWIYTRMVYKKSGIILGLAEINFLNAYRLYASGLDKAIDVSVSDDELKEENWREAYRDLVRNWPKVASRFSVD